MKDLNLIIYMLHYRIFPADNEGFERSYRGFGSSSGACRVALARVAVGRDQSAGEPCEPVHETLREKQLADGDAYCETHTVMFPMPLLSG